jgi:hypothetical protein
MSGVANRGKGIHHNRKNAQVTRTHCRLFPEDKASRYLGAPTFYQGLGGLSHRVDVHTQRS